MEMKLLSKDKNKVTFLVKGTSPAEVNTIRRIIINKVPTMAIDTLEIVDNSSALYDEMLAHRLGLVVFETDLKSYFEQERCKCKGEGCARCNLLMTLDIEGPEIVYAEHIKTNDPKIVPKHPKTLIVKLLEGQKIKLIATAKLGSGKEHIKFSPGSVYYKGNPEIKIGNVKNAQEVESMCPRKVYKIEGNKLKINKKDDCILCNACVDASNKEISVSASDKDFIVTIEPWGQLDPIEMVSTAADIISRQTQDVAEAIKKLK
ncbi:MAG: DNA-directed RNA polymerase subunit D [archaeon]